MNLELTAEEKAFQQEVRAFLDAKLPQDMRQRTIDGCKHFVEDAIAWEKTLYEQGWVAPNWPVEHGGTGWTPIQRYIFELECAQAGAPRVNAFNLHMIGPVIYTFGSEGQKDYFLPRILKSDIFFCQGYSEPDSGSDLASLQTTAVRDGDEYVVNGTKMWITLAQHADWIFCLVRTGESDIKNQEAISFLLIDLSTPGITMTPIITLDGEHEVNQIFFDNVRVPVGNRIGDENRGWHYAKMLLQHERTNTALVGDSKRRLAKLRRMAAETPDGDGSLLDNAAFASKLADVEVELLALEYTELRELSAVSTGRAPGPESSILKLLGTRIAQSIDDLLVETAGYYSLPFVKGQFELDFSGETVGPGTASDTGPRYFNNRKLTIFGGSNEIQKNIICKHVLGL